jgi:sulfoxide reductase heme-binding subunit YedZ
MMDASPPVLAAAQAASELPTQWLLARSSGIVAYLLLTLAVVAGLTLRTRLLGRTVPPAIVTAVHRTLSLVGLSAVVLHAVLIGLDHEVDVPLVALLVPGLSGYRPLATALGVVAMELWLLIHLSFRMRRRIGVKRWRALHMATFPTWGIAAAHGVLAGTDSSVDWMQHLYAWSIAAVVFLVVIRGGSRAAARAPRPPATTPTPSPTPPATTTPRSTPA